MPADNQAEAGSAEHGWDEHNLSQLRYFRSLSLREKLQAVEGMADVVRHFRQIRAQADSRRRHDSRTNPERPIPPSIHKLPIPC